MMIMSVAFAISTGRRCAVAVCSTPGCGWAACGLALGQLESAEPQLVKAFIAGKLFFREHEVTGDAISVLADSTSVLHVCLKQRNDIGLASEVVTSTAHTLSRVMESKGLRREAMHACNHLLTLHEIPQQVPAAAQLAMARYIKNPREIAH